MSAKLKKKEFLNSLKIRSKEKTWLDGNNYLSISKRKS